MHNEISTKTFTTSLLEDVKGKELLSSWKMDKQVRNL
jgi:hypothetical protein